MGKKTSRATQTSKGERNNVAPDGTGFIHKPGYTNYDADVKT